jgi:hypothetical protein
MTRAATTLTGDAQRPASWPRAALQQLLEQDSSCSTAGSSRQGDGGGDDGEEAVSAAAAATTSCSSSGGAATGRRANMQQQLTALAGSRFSFPDASGSQPAPLQYVTPIKIPHPPHRRRRRGGGASGSGTGPSSTSSSPAGSYVALAQQHSLHPAGAGGGGTSGGQYSASRTSPDQQATPSPLASSMSSEAAALLQALRLAAEQRRISQGVLTSRSSYASALGSEHAAAGTPQQHQHQQALEGGADALDRRAAEAAANKMQAAAAGQQPDVGASCLPAGSPQGSVLGPLALVPRSVSVAMLQQSAAERLLQDALDSSSYGSLMALLDSSGGGDGSEAEEGEDEVEQQQQQPGSHQPLAITAADGAAQPHVAACGAAGAGSGHVLPAVASSQRRASGVASTWGSCLSTPQVGDSREPTPRTDAFDGMPPVGQGSGQPRAEPSTLTEQPQQQPQPQHCNHQQGSRSSLSRAASDLASEVLSAELQLLARQVEAERLCLDSLQQQRSQLQQELRALSPGVQPGSRVTGVLPRSRSCSSLSAATGGGTADEAAGLTPHTCYMSATSGDSAEGQQQQQSEQAAVVATPLPAFADAALQTDDNSSPAAPAPDTHDAACQALLLHAVGLPAVGPPCACRACPMLQQQLAEAQHKLVGALEQHKQVRAKKAAPLLTRSLAACSLACPPPLNTRAGPAVL